MARNPDAPSRMEILVLSALARMPMHGYELKLEFRYKHVRWWAKAEHGHLYAALQRLARKKLIHRVGRERRRRVYAITAAGRKKVESELAALGRAPDATYFDVDLFLSGAFLLERRLALQVLEERRTTLAEQRKEALALQEGMLPYVPAAGRLIMEHRIEHLTREIDFAARAIEAVRAEAAWGSFLGGERIGSFVQRSGVEIEGEPRGRRK